MTPKTEFPCYYLQDNDLQDYSIQDGNSMIITYKIQENYPKTVTSNNYGNIQNDDLQYIKLKYSDIWDVFLLSWRYKMS